MESENKNPIKAVAESGAEATKVNKLVRIKGFEDLFPPLSDLFVSMEGLAREVFGLAGFVEVRPPILEYTDLFRHAIGTETDVVQKEMFSLTDSKGRLMSLRPEATSGVLRAYLQANLAAKENISRLFTTGAMFRHERPQKGRLRQFHQINCECLGCNSPYIDADLIILLLRYLKSLNLSKFTLKINSLGCKECRPVFKAKLKEYLDHIDANSLCEDCLRRKDTNPLRVLDCKQASCKEQLANAPSLSDCLCPACKEHFAEVLLLLQAQQIEYQLDPYLVRGLDYYCRTTFEVVSNEIGAQAAIAGGGRYDGLLQTIGGANSQDIPGIGFAIGMERLALLLNEPTSKAKDCFIVTTQADAICRRTAFELMQKLREAKISADMAFNEASFKSQMRQADKQKASYCLLLGPDEVASSTVQVKNMSTGEQNPVDLAKISEHLTTLLNNIAK